MAIYNGNYIGKNDPTLGQTQSIQNSGLETTTVDILRDKYQINLFNDMQTYIAESVPMLTLLESMGSESMVADAFIWQDEYKGDMMFDVALEDLRLRSVINTSTTNLPSSYSVQVSKIPYAVNNSSQLGGKFNFKNVASWNSTSKDLTLGTSDFGLVGGEVAAASGDFGPNMVAIGADNTNIRGSIDNVAQRFHQLLTNMNYATTGTTSTTLIFKFDASTSTPVYMVFDNLVIASPSGAETEQLKEYNSVIVLVSEFWFTLAGKLAIVLDLSNSNHSLLKDENCRVLYSVPGSSDVFDYNVTTPSRMLFVGQRQSAPLPVAQGDSFSFGGNFNTWREELSNNTQIFTTPKYGLTGTKIASSFRFSDDMIETRNTYFAEYKKNMDAAFKYGIKTRQRVSSASNTFMSSQEVTTVGGLMDYSLFPIKYIKAPLAQVDLSTSATTAATTLMNYIDRLANNLVGFRVNSSKSITLLCSDKMIKKLNPLVRLSMGSAGFMGGNVQISQPSEMSFGLKAYTYESSDGIMVNFVHDPSLDFMPSMPIPYVIFGKENIPGRDVMLMIDKGNMKKMTLRADKIEGNLQDIGQDAVLEAMRGEHSLKLRYPKNFAVIWCPES